MKLNRITLPFLFAFASASLAFAQPQLTASDLPSAGDKKVDYVADSVGVEPGPAGASMSWDFSTLARIGTNDSVVSEVVTASSTPYASDFPSANLAAKSVSGSSWAYYSASGTQVSLVGVASGSGSNTVKQKYSDPEIILKVPFTYNQSMSDEYEASYDASGVSVLRSGAVTATADAYGTLIMPHRTFTDVLRVKNVSVTKDSFDLGGQWFSSVTEATSYSYISPGRVAPILTILYTSSSSNGIPSDETKLVTYNETEALASVKPVSMLSSDVNLYPNPTSSGTTIQVDAKTNCTIQVSISTMLGKTITSNSADVRTGLNTIPLSTERLSAGIYLVNISDGNSTLTRRLVIE